MKAEVSGIFPGCRSAGIVFAAMSIALMLSGNGAGAQTPEMKSGDGEIGGYIEFGATYDWPSDPSAKYQTGDAEYGLDNAKGGKFQVGFDFGKIRLELRAAAHETDVDTVARLAANSPYAENEAYFGSLRFNLFWDIYRFSFFDQSGFFALGVTPFVGAGVGGAAVYLQAGQTDPRDPASGGDTQVAGGAGGGVGGGILIDITNNVGITLGYDFEAYHFNSSGAAFYNHSAEAGLRITF